MRKLTRIEQANADLLGDAALFHVTGTILNKSIQDCNAAIRDLLKREGVLDYDELRAGEKVTLEGVIMTEPKPRFPRIGRRHAGTKESGLTV